MVPEVALDMLTLILYGILLTKPQYQVKFTYLVGALFILAISVKYLTEFKSIGTGIQVLAILMWCIQHYFYLKKQA